MNPEPNPAPAGLSGSLEDVLAVKKAKLKELRDRGVDCFPPRFEKTHACDQLQAIGKPLEIGASNPAPVTCAGRLIQLRDMGKSIFATIQDGTDKVQIYFKKDALPEALFLIVKKDLHPGDFIGASGTMFKTRTGEPTVAATSVTLLAKALRPMPEKFHGLKDVETRYRHRHLDLISSEETRKVFRQRSIIVSTVRRTLESMGFVEVETPILLPTAGGASARPFTTHHNALDRDMVMRIATELHLKRLIIGGMDKVFELGRLFRNEGIDTKHNPEFTTVEAYQAYTDYHGMAKLFEETVWACAQALGKESVEYNDKLISLKPPFHRVSLPELWKEACGEPIESVLQGISFDRKALLALANRIGVPAGEGTPSAKVFERVFDGKILPRLEGMNFVLDHPAAITPLAKLKPGSPSIVERFECFGGGDEFANAYTELNDPEDQLERLRQQARVKKEEKDEEADVLDNDFVEALECGMPPTGGIGFGIDRLVMLLTGQSSIRETILFPMLKEG
ncbi:MAG: lysine--tRNA ligase [Elusimicrobia bacterium]|nr:lysine--tRNA ligase [Elusimicrobiota bacterium]